MKLKIAPNDVQSMSQDGDAILRSLQNNKLPIIDLIVRESLQNSLDATINDAEKTIVEFKTNKFNSELLSPYLEGIETELNNNYSGEQEFLAISDKMTNGLTGDFKSESAEVLDKSNFHKLVFGIGKNQNKEGAGGSWGLGKTSYFRIGIGVVMYYTRIATEIGYEERLVASLIESPKQNHRLLRKSERGIAWWGEFDETKTKIYPITDREKISEILNIFGMENYEKDETGTTIIIPYLKNFEQENRDSEVEVYPWEHEIEDAINIAVQRWYSPRIWNEKYREKLNNSMLDCKVNGNPITPYINMEPTFEIFRDLYTSALINEPQKENIKVKPIYLPRNSVENKKDPIGHLAFCEVNKSDLRMLPPENKASGLAYIGVKNLEKMKGNNSKVIAYSRKPGMIVEYNIDGDWSPNGIIQTEDCMIFGFFVPNSEAILLKKFRELGYKNLESYLRATENADHANWEDEDGIGIIQRMKNYSSNAILNEYQDGDDNKNTSATTGLSRKYGAIFMPPKSFGKTSTIKSSNTREVSSGTSRRRNSDIIVNKTSLKDSNNVEVSFEATIKKNTNSTIFLQVLTQEQKMNKEIWIKTMGDQIEFPFKIENVFIEKIEGETFNDYIDELNNDEVSFEMNGYNELNVHSTKSNTIEVIGKLFISVNSNQYIPNVAIKTKKDEEVGD